MPVPEAVQREFEAWADQYVSDWSKELLAHVKEYEEAGGETEDGDDEPAEKAAGSFRCAHCGNPMDGDSVLAKGSDHGVRYLRDANPGDTLFCSFECLKYSYGVVMIEIDSESPAGRMIDLLQSMVQESDLAGKGFEKNPHVTVRYGITDNQTSGIVDYLQSLEPFQIALGTVDAFPASDHTGGAAVLIVNVESATLPEVNEQLAAVGNFKPADFDYHAHVTLAYVKPEEVDAYLRLMNGAFFSPKGFTHEVRSICVRSKDEGQEPIRVELLGTSNGIPEPVERGEVIQQTSSESPRAPEHTPGDLKKAGKKTVAGEKPDAMSPAKRQAVRDIERYVFHGLRKTVKDFEASLERGFEAGISAQQLVDDLEFESLLGAVAQLKEPIAAIVADVAAREITRVITVDNNQIFDLLNERAIAFAERRAAAMVGKRVVDGRLVDNPNAKWSITETTREALRDMITAAYDAGLTPNGLKDSILGSFAFSESRAKMIAMTEMANASIQGTLTAWRESGVVTHKQSLLSHDHPDNSECDCEANAEAGEIPIDEDFPSGDDGPPYHPNCWCSLVAGFGDAAESNREGSDADEGEEE